MSAFPTLSYGASDKSKWLPVNDIEVTLATNGASHTRGFHPAQKRAGEFVFEGCTASDVTSVMSFFDSNKLSVFTFVWPVDSVTYSCRFSGVPQCPMVAPGVFQITVPAVEA